MQFDCAKLQIVHVKILLLISYLISIAIVSGGYIWYYYGVDIYTLRLDYQREKWNLIDYPLKESLEVLIVVEKAEEESMFGNERKIKVTLVADEDEQVYAKLLQGLISTKDDEEESIVGVKDGSVESVLWLFKEKEGNRPTISSEQKMIYFGKNKMTKDEIEIMNEKYNYFGMHYGWIGNTAVIYVDKTSKSLEEYETFLKKAEEIGLKFEHADEKNELKKVISKGKGIVENVANKKVLKTFLSSPISKVGKKVTDTMSDKIEDTVGMVWGKELWKQQYTFLITHFYLNAMNQFLGE